MSAAVAGNVGGGGGGGGGAENPVDEAAGGGGEEGTVVVAVGCPFFQGCQASAMALAAKMTVTAATAVSHQRRERLTADRRCGGLPAADARGTPGPDPGRSGAGLVAATGDGDPYSYDGSARARVKSEHRGKRSSGSFASALAKTGSRAASSGRVSAKAGGGELRWRLMTTAGLECGKSCDPVSS